MGELTVFGGQCLRLPSLPRLKELRIILRGRASSNTTPLPTFVDLSTLPCLNTLRVEGDIWSGFESLFTGKTTSVTTCLLRGPLVLSSRLEPFFERMSSCLRNLHCFGTHFISDLSVDLPTLRYLGLHRVITAGPRFPFRNVRLATLCLENDEIYAIDNTPSLTFASILESALRDLPELKHLFLRSSMAWAPSHSTLRRLQSSNLEMLMLDGAICLDPSDDQSLCRYSNLQTFIKVGLFIEVSDRLTSASPMMVTRL